MNLRLTFSGHKRIMQPMLKVCLIGFLSLVLLCMIPIMGSPQHHSGHLHHDDSASCATCMVSVNLPLNLSFLSPLGMAISAIHELPKLLAPRLLFHPPRFLS
jgi:hypothetical protein